MESAAEIMTRRVVTAKPDDTVGTVARLLVEHHISAVPVCDDGGEIVGMVSEGDLMRPFGRESEVRRSWWLELLAEGTDLAPGFIEYLRVEKHYIRDLMVTPVITAPESASAGELADLLANHGIKRVPIVRGEKLVGIVSRTDVLRALARMPQSIVSPD
jgi:CBS domain-containing protein